MDTSENTPQIPKWSIEQENLDQPPPVPLHIKLDDGTTYVPGIGSFDAEGRQVIGLPGSHMRAITRSLLSGDFEVQLHAGLELDRKIEATSDKRQDPEAI